MIRAIVRIDGKDCTLTIEGHATGSREVCAAASALVYALSGYLVNDGAAHILQNDLNSGDAAIRCAGGRGVQAAFRMAGVGLAQLGRQFPEYISAELIARPPDQWWNRGFHPL